MADRRRGPGSHRAHGASPRPSCVDIPGGRFRMGSEHGRADERPVRDVEVAAFALARTPVTRAQYAPFLASGAAEAPPWWDDAEFGAPRSAGRGRHLVRGVLVRGVAVRGAGGAGGCRRKRSGSAPRGAASIRRATAWGDSLPPGEVPDGPLARAMAGRARRRRTASACATWAPSSTSGASTGTRRDASGATTASRRGAPAAADRGGITCAGRRLPPGAACPRRSATPTTASACSGSARSLMRRIP